jgi:aminoacrylate hydrolase
MYFEEHGLSGEDTPTLVMSSGLGGSARYWQPQLSALTKDYRVIVYDHLGTGRSSSPLPANYSITHMADELLALLDKLAIKQCHIIGHALGGLVALQIAAQQPQRLLSMVLVNAWGRPNPHSLRCFNIRKAILANCDKNIYLQTQALILYPPDWIVDNIDSLEKEEQHMLENFPNIPNLLARINALCAFNLEQILPSIKVPSLIVANKDDALVPWRCSQQLANQLPHATLELLNYGGHASSVTTPSLFNTLLIEHLSAYTQLNQPNLK